MIGVISKGFQYALTHIGPNPKYVISQCNDTIIDGICMTTDMQINQSDKTKQIILFFNNEFGQQHLPSFVTSSQKYNEYFEKYNYCGVITDSWNYEEVFRYQLLILPNNFNEEYEKFTKQNSKLFSPINSYLKTPHGKFLYAKTNGSAHLVLWGLNNIIKYGVSIYTINNIINWSNNYPQIVKNTSKNSITAYNNSQISTLVNEMQTLIKDARAKKSISMFNTQQKKSLRKLYETKNDDIIELLNKFYLLSFAKKHNFIRKMSTIEDNEIHSIIHQMELLTKKQFTWSKDSLLDYIANAEINCQVIIDRDDLLVIKIDDYDSIKYLAKNTNWCISKNKMYWNRYIEANTPRPSQFILYDFSKKEDDDLSIIGFTVINNYHIAHAHSFSNKCLMPYDTENMRNMLTTLCPIKPNDINHILSKHNISLDELTKPITTTFNWNKESVIECFKQMDDNDYTILNDEGDKLAVMTYTKKLHRLLGKDLMRLIYRKLVTSNAPKNIFFFDFSLNNRNRKRFVVATVRQSDNDRHIEYVQGIYDTTGQVINETFNQLIHKWNLPYNVICRIENNINKLKDAFQQWDTSLINVLLQDENIRHEIASSNRYKNILSNTLFNTLHTTISRHLSLDILDSVYNNDIKLNQLMGNSNINNLLMSFFPILNDYMFDIIDENHLNKTIKQVLNHKCKDENKCIFVAMFLAIKNIMSHEDKFFLSNLGIKSYISRLNPVLLYALIPHLLNNVNNTFIFSLLIKKEMLDVIENILTNNTIDNNQKNTLIKMLPNTDTFNQIKSKTIAYATNV